MYIKKIEVIAEADKSKIYINGRLLRGVTSFKLEHTAGNLPKVLLEAEILYPPSGQ